MKAMVRGLLTAAALASVAMAAAPASAQPYYGYRDDGPPPFRRGPGWDGPPRAPWDRWHHHRRWRDDGFDRRGWRDGERREGRDRFGDEGRDRRFGDEGRDRRFGGEGRDRRFGGEDAQRERGDGDAPRRGGRDRNDRRPFDSGDN